MAYKLVSLNCCGLRSRLKRRSIFSFLKKNKFHIICLQESHITKSDAELWKKEWGGDLFYIAGTTHSKGQLILINKNMEIQNPQVHTTGDRILAVTFIFKGEAFAVMNVYGPNLDAEKTGFLDDVKNTMQQFGQNHHLIVSGDWNLVLSNSLDVITGKPHDPNLVAKFNELISGEDLYDVWRLYHGQTKEFTWSSHYSPWIARRLDYIFVNSSMFDKINASNISPVPNSDHQGVDIEFHMENIKKGPSYWKFNNS